MYLLPFVLLMCLFGSMISAADVSAVEDHSGSEILWDSWGVPHIFSPKTEGIFYAFGWAQMESHGDLILKLYGEARARASEYWGVSYLESDTFIRKMGVPERGKQWVKSYSAEFQRYLQAFARGMNDYARKFKNKLDKKRLVVLPITPGDVLAHIQRVIHLEFVADAAGEIRQWNSAGSNGWAIAPSNAAGGNAMLLSNPHLPWSDFYLFFEAHLKGPSYNAYGVTLVGSPILAIAFNDYLGWTHTVNTNDSSDLYELTLVDNGYLFDGKTRRFKTESHTIKIKEKSGAIREKKLVIEHSIHGPVVAKTGKKALVLRTAGLDKPLICKQWFDMMRATNLKEFEKAMQDLQMPMFNTIYADRDGHIMMLHNACLPKRSRGDWRYWSGIVPGDRSETLWQGYHRYDELPRVVDPANGWVQNCNDPPWTCTFPMVLKPGDYPPYFSPGLDYIGVYSAYILRSQRSIRMLREDKKISFSELIQYKHSTRMELADRILDDLFPAVEKYGSPLAKKAAKVLEKWDRKADVHSRGAVLFQAWVKESPVQMFSKKWGEGPLHKTPDGLKDPAAAAAALDSAAGKVLKNYRALDIPWGDVYRLAYAGKNFPGNGGSGRLGVFRVLYFTGKKGGTFTSVGGDTYVAAVEFSNPVKARVLLSYGNSSQPDSPHRGDQLELLSKKKLRPAWRTKVEIEKHLEKKEELFFKTSVK